MAMPYVYSAAAAWTEFSMTAPLAAGAAAGVAETAVECGLAGDCSASGPDTPEYENLLRQYDWYEEYW